MWPLIFVPNQHTHRYICFTFSGVVFEDRTEVDSKSKSRQQQQINKRKLAIYQGSFEPKAFEEPSNDGLSANSLGILAIGILYIGSYFIPFYYTIFAKHQMVTTTAGQGYNSSSISNNSDEELTMANFFGLDKYQIGFGQLKPILSAVMNMVSFYG